jgi:parallel beta-helix repeat protein
MLATVFAVAVSGNVSADFIGDVTIDSEGNVIPDTAPISVLGTIYTLTDNIYGRITIQKSGITLNGNGYTLQGSGSGNGIYLNGISYVTIKNLDIRDFDLGISIWYSNSNIICSNTFYGNYAGIVLFYPIRGVIRSNTFFDNVYGIALVGSGSDNTVSQNTITGGFFGIYLLYFQYSDYRNTINDNTISDTSDAGIYLEYSNGITISQNTISRSGNYGIYAYQSHSNSINGNTIYSCNYGIYSFSSADANIIDNIMENNNYGMYIYTYFYTRYPVIINNIVTSNQKGIYLYGSRNCWISQNTVTNNNEGFHAYYSNQIGFIQNEITGNNQIGLYLDHSYGNAIRENLIKNNLDGIKCYDSRYNRIKENEISTNNGYGIYMDMSDYNSIYHNNFVRNTNQKYNNGMNTWDNGNGEGNYWSDYRGRDIDGDGIGDTKLPHQEVDEYPFMLPIA